MIVFGWVVFEQSKFKDAGSQQLVAVESKVFLKLSGESLKSVVGNKKRMARTICHPLGSDFESASNIVRFVYPSNDGRVFESL
jgi:hypothetical protein